MQLTAVALLALLAGPDGGYRLQKTVPVPGASATVIDAAAGKAAGTIDLGGKPESAVADGAGHVFVNLEDKNELLKLDAHRLAVLGRFPIAPGATPVSLAIDPKNQRLFVGC